MKNLIFIIKTFLRLVLKPLSFLPAIIMMYVIFQFSSQDGATSSQISYQVSYQIVTLADKAFDLSFSETEIAYHADKIHHYVRKLAHVTEYFILAITISFPLYVYGIRGLLLVFLSVLFCVGFAGLDEYHQSFVSARGPSAKDVLIDSIGILPGIYLVRIFGYIGRKTLFRPLSKNN